MTTDANSPAPDRLLTSTEVAGIYRVDVRTVTRWAKAGKLPPDTVTPGGRPRWRESAIRAQLAAAAQS